MPKDGKSGPLSETDLEFLGYSTISTHQPSEFGLPERCRIFDAVAPAGVTTVRHWFIYALSDCTNNDIEKISSALNGDIFENEICQIVVPKSLSNRGTLISANYPHSVHVFEDLMWRRINQEFKPYMDRLNDRINGLKSGIPYVEPTLHLDGKNIRPINHFVRYFSGHPEEGNGLSIVNAEASVGKTTLSIMVANELLENWEKLRVIPLLLTGQTSWGDLTEISHKTMGLWDIVYRAVNLEGGKFPLNNEVLFTRILRQGYIAFIFDGFDELRSTELSPKDNFSWLIRIAENSSARVLVTARTSFLKREMDDLDSEYNMFEIKPFNEDTARQYFRKFFEGEDEKNTYHGKAMQLYRQLQKASQLQKFSSEIDESDFRFVDLPACAAMIADYVKRGGRVPIDLVEEKKIIDEFFHSVLARERERQRIDVSIEKMLSIFSDLAVSYDEFSLEDIQIAGLNVDVDESHFTKIHDHAFLNSIPGQDKFQFKYEFLLHYLRASHILFVLKESTGKRLIEKFNGDLLKLVQAEANGQGHLSDQIANFCDEDDLQSLIDAHQQCNDNSLWKLKSFLFHVISKTVNLHLSGNSRDERTRGLFSRLGAVDNSVSDLRVEGSLNDLSLKRWTIENSIFVDLVMIRCETDNLKFVNCKFFGVLDIRNSNNVQYYGCTGEGGAELIIKDNDTNRISEENIREYLKFVLWKRFFPGRHFRTVAISEWKTGRTKNIEDRFDLLDILIREGLVKKTIRDRLEVTTPEIGNVRDFIDNGILKGGVKKVYDQMKSRLDNA